MRAGRSERISRALCSLGDGLGARVSNPSIGDAVRDGSHGSIAGLEDDGKLREIFRANQAVTGSGSFTRMDKKKAMTVEEEQAEARRRVDAAEAAVLTLDNYAKFSDGVYDRVRDGDPVIFILIAVIVYVVVNEVYRVLPTALACACTMLGSRLYYKRRLLKTTKRLQAVHNTALQWTPSPRGDRQLDQLDHGEHVDGHPRAETHRRGEAHHHARARAAKLRGSSPARR